MNKLLFLLMGLLLPAGAIAQYTDIINSNLPGNSQSAYAVGGRVLQFEGGLWYESSHHKLTATTMHYVGLNYAVRYGFYREQLEVMLNGILAYDYTTMLGHSASHLSFVNNTIGAKYLLFKPKFLDEEPNIYSWKANNALRWRNMIPSVAIYVGANFLPNQRYYYERMDVISPKVAAIFQMEPMPRIVVVGNLIADRFIKKEQTEYSYLLTLTHNLRNGWFSIFAEQQGIYGNNYSDQITRLGAAYIANADLQLNADLGVGWNDTPQRYMILVGASYRIDKHNGFIKKKLKEKIKTTKISRKKKPKKKKKTAEPIDFD